MGNTDINTIILAETITLTDNVSVEHDVTIRLNGNDLNMSGNTFTGDGEVNIENVMGDTILNGKFDGIGKLILVPTVDLANVCLEIDTVELSTADHLDVALEGTVETIILGDDITLSEALDIEREVTIDGGNNTLTFTEGEMQIDAEGDTVTLNNLKVVAHDPNLLPPASAYAVYVSAGTLHADNLEVDLKYDDEDGIAPAGISFHYDTTGELNNVEVTVDSQSAAPYGIYISANADVTVTTAEIDLGVCSETP